MNITVSDAINRIRSNLFSMADEGYKSFHSKLIPNIPAERIIGVRTPELRRYASSLYSVMEKGCADADEFLSFLPHYYYEENNLHGFLIEKCTDINECFAMLDVFLPHVDNWATCDMTSPKIFGKHKKEAFEKACQWISSSHTYTCRFGIRVLMCFFLGEDFNISHTDIVLSVKNDDYYVKMMKAWYLASLGAERFSLVYDMLRKEKIPADIRKMTSRKLLDSLRISREQKELIKLL